MVRCWEAISYYFIMENSLYACRWKWLSARDAEVLIEKSCHCLRNWEPVHKASRKAAVGKCSDLNLKWISSYSILRTRLFYTILYVQAALHNFLQRQLHIFAFPHIWRAPVWPYFLMTKASVTKHKEYAGLQLLIKFQQISSCVILHDSEAECTWASSTQQFGRVFGHAASLKAEGSGKATNYSLQVRYCKSLTSQQNSSAVRNLLHINWMKFTLSLETCCI